MYWQRGSCIYIYYIVLHYTFSRVYRIIHAFTVKSKLIYYTIFYQHLLLFFSVLYVMVYWQKCLYLLLIDTSNCGNLSGNMMTPRQSSQVGDIFQLAAHGWTTGWCPRYPLGWSTKLHQVGSGVVEARSNDFGDDILQQILALESLTVQTDGGNPAIISNWSWRTVGF